MGSAECLQAPATDVVGPGSTAPADSRLPRVRGGPWPGRRWLALLLALTAALTLVPVPAAAALPWQRGTPATRQGEAPPSPFAPQEIAPPLGVQQLRPLLEAHQPRLRIVSPQSDSLVPAGPWNLQLELSDWPLLDAGAEGLGPHLVVQLDEDPPLRLTATSVVMPPLAPGSHRLSVFAALPWGEAMRNPGAFTQIRLHRSAANPLAGPAPGTPQLIPLLPVAAPAKQPLLLDWILLDAPLQHLRGGDDSWRLRINLDGEALLLDRQDPLWLRGLGPGRHPLVLELLDPRGEPLNPPYNSLVRELVTGAEGPAPPWLLGPLSASQLARLSGAAPPAPERGGDDRQAERPRDPSQPRGVEAPASALDAPGGANQPEAGTDPQPVAPAREASPRRSAAGEPELAEPSDVVVEQPGALPASAAGPSVAVTSRADSSVGLKHSANGGASSSSSAASPLSPERGAIPPGPEPMADSPLAAASTPKPQAAQSPQAQPSRRADQQTGHPDRQPTPRDPQSVPPDQRPLPEDERLLRAPTARSQALTFPMETPGSPQPGAGPTPAAPEPILQTARSGPKPQAAQTPQAEETEPADQQGGQPMEQTPRSDQQPAPPDPRQPSTGGAASPRSASGEPETSSTEPLGADRGALPLAPLPSEEGAKSVADRPSRSRSVSDDLPTPSLSPRPSPPEPFDPWSTPLAADPAALQDCPHSRPDDSNGPLERLRRLVNR